MIGASAGGIPPLTKLIAELPGDLAAAVFVVVHVPPSDRSDLPAILARAGRLPAKHPESGELLRSRHIYVAPPDHHLLLDQDHILLWRGPRENRHRPAINTSFRTAATTFRERVIGVVLSGMLDDGAAGLWWIKKFGGTAMIQDPDESQFSSMPDAALEYVTADHVAPAAQLGKLVARLTQDESATTEQAQKERT